MLALDPHFLSLPVPYHHHHWGHNDTVLILSLSLSRSLFLSWANRVKIMIIGKSPSVIRGYGNEHRARLHTNLCILGLSRLFHEPCIFCIYIVCLIYIGQINWFGGLKKKERMPLKGYQWTMIISHPVSWWCDDGNGALIGFSWKPLHVSEYEKLQNTWTSRCPLI